MGIAETRRPIPEQHMLQMLHLIPRVVPPARVVAALTVGLAGLIHLALIREYFKDLARLPG